MITPSTGEVGFDDGLRITAHCTIAAFLAAMCEKAAFSRPFPVEGWHQYALGIHKSSYGSFVVELVTGAEKRVEAVFLSHCHEFYEAGTFQDSERRAFHEGVIASDLRGQREFSWGNVFCRLDRKANQDWLVVIYNPFSTVPLHEREIYKALMEHEPTPNAISDSHNSPPV